MDRVPRQLVVHNVVLRDGPRVLRKADKHLPHACGPASRPLGTSVYVFLEAASFKEDGTGTSAAIPN